MHVHGDYFSTLDPDLDPASLLVDFTPIQQADQILEECTIFLQQAGDTNFVTFPLLTRLSTVKNWRVRRRDNRLISVHEGLFPRVLVLEGVLRGIIGDVVERKADIRCQARHLQSRLLSCISFNTTSLLESEAPVEELRGGISLLSTRLAQLKDMLEFNKELVRFRSVERVSKGMTFVRWGGMGAKNATLGGKKPLSEAELQQDDSHSDIEARLLTLRQLREKFSKALGVVLEARGGSMSCLDNCEHSLGVVRGMLIRGGLRDAEGNASAATSPTPPTSPTSPTSPAPVSPSEQQQLSEQQISEERPIEREQQKEQREQEQEREQQQRERQQREQQREQQRLWQTRSMWVPLKVGVGLCVGARCGGAGCTEPADALCWRLQAPPPQPPQRQRRRQQRLGKQSYLRSGRP
mmetsp:Transcript_563/g.1177  ORF Transcript_563/g.1177 Transcript_563/m.1177 type:complete len:409 (-) Transcript_563:937-2163(-)